jgi:hypothetical protein
MMHNQKMDSERERDAFNELRPWFDQLGELRRATVDVEKAAAHAAVIGRMVKQPQMYELFAKLPPEAFELRHVNNLEKAALATRYAVVKHRNAAVHESQAIVPADISQQATDLRYEMLQVVKYHLRDPNTAAIIADIEAGQGHADRALDLLRLGELYIDNHPRLAQDHTYYRRDDAEKAREIASRIYDRIGGDGESQERIWASYVQRAWTFLLDTYDEVSAAGRWLYRHDNGDERFPSLITAQRQTAKRNGRPDDTTAAEAEAEAGILAQPETIIAAEADILAQPQARPEATIEAS